jgi:predicted Zn-dependent peptidase
VKLRIAALVAFAFLAAAPSVTRAADAVPVVTRGDGVTVIQQQDAVAPLLHVAFVVRAGLNRQSLAQNGLAALTAQTILRTPVGGVTLEDAVAANGGSISFTVNPANVRFDIDVLPDDATRVLGLAKAALAAPAFNATTVGAARAHLIQRIAQHQEIALQVGLDMLSSTLVSSANAGLPELGIPAALAQLGPKDASAFYAAYYHRGGSYVSAAGRVDVLAAGTLDAFGQILPEGSSDALNVKLPKLDGQSRQYVAQRDISAPWLVAQYPAPAISSKDFGPMLVLASFMQRTLADMADVPGVVSQTFASHAVGAVYQYDNPNPDLVLYVNGGIGNPNRSFATALSIANILATTKLNGSIENFKAMASGDFISSTSTLEARAWLAVLYDENGQQADYVGRTLDAISQTTGADLQRVAREYMSNPTIALVLPREDS